MKGKDEGAKSIRMESGGYLKELGLGEQKHSQVCKLEKSNRKNYMKEA